MVGEWMDGWKGGRDPLAGVEDKMLKWNSFQQKISLYI